MNTFTERKENKPAMMNLVMIPLFPSLSLSLSLHLSISPNFPSTDKYMPIVVFALIKKLKHFRNMREIGFI